MAKTFPIIFSAFFLICLALFLFNLLFFFPIQHLLYQLVAFHSPFFELLVLTTILFLLFPAIILMPYSKTLKVLKLLLTFFLKVLSFLLYIHLFFQLFQEYFFFRLKLLFLIFQLNQLLLHKLILFQVEILSYYLISLLILKSLLVKLLVQHQLQ